MDKIKKIGYLTAVLLLSLLITILIIALIIGIVVGFKEALVSLFNPHSVNGVLFDLAKLLFDIAFVVFIGKIIFEILKRKKR